MHQSLTTGGNRPKIRLASPNLPLSRQPVGAQAFNRSSNFHSIFELCVTHASYHPHTVDAAIEPATRRIARQTRVPLGIMWASRMAKPFLPALLLSFSAILSAAEDRILR